MLPSYNQPIDVTEGAGISEYTKRKIKPNFDFMHAHAGFYCVANGIPVYKFHIPIRSGTTYTKRVISYGDRGTEYTLSDSSGNNETWYDTSPETRFRRESKKMFSKGVEYHLKIPCLDADKKKCGLPYNKIGIPPFPVDIVNFAPLKVKLYNNTLRIICYN